MLDRLYLPFLGLVAAAAIALSLVWPQGLGDRSPDPFGHTPVQQTPEVQAAMRRQTEAAVRRAGVWVLAPLGLCFLPAFVCLGVAPLVLGIAVGVFG